MTTPTTPVTPDRFRFAEARGWRAVVLPLIVAALFSGATGCSTMSSIEAPDVTLVNLDIQEVTVFETTLNASLRISNPNPEALELEGAAFKLVLDGRKVGRGMMSEAVTVDRLDSEVVDVVFHVNNASALLRAPEILKNEAVSYGVRATLYIEGTFGTKKIKVERSGRLDLSKGLDIEPAQPEDGVLPL